MAVALVVDDDAFTRTLVGALLTGLGHDVRTAGSVADAMTLARDARPGLAVVDLDLGEGPTGIDLAHGLRRLDPDLPVVVLTSYDDPTHAGQRRSLPAGIPYVVKGALDDPAVLARAVEDAQAGRATRTTPAASGSSALGSGPLSAGQWETMRLVAAGHSNAEIARRRQLTEDAVNKSISRLVRQLGLDVGAGENVRVLIAREYFNRTGTVSARRD